MFAVFKKAATKNTHVPYLQEAKALLFFTVSLLLAAALISHNPHDLSWFYYDTLGQPITNWCGYFGSCCAAFLFYLFGSGSLILVGFFFFWGYFLLYKKTVTQEWDRFAAYIILLFAITTLLALHKIDFFASPLPGGYCGHCFQYILNSWFDTLGTFILVYALIFMALILITRLSFIKIVHGGIKVLVIPFALLVNAVYRCGAKVLSAAYGWLHTKIVPEPSREADADADYAFWHEIMNGEKKSFEPQERQPLEQNHEIREPLPENYSLPGLDMFIGVEEESNDHALMQELEKRAVILQEKLERFGIYGKVTAIKRGPVVTLFEYQPQIDTKISKIIALEDDLALALQATSIRIIAPIPGRSVVGFEVANKQRRNVLLSTLIKTETYLHVQASLPMILGVDTVGNTVIIDLAKMPHLLMAGSTGSGKSVALNAMLVSLLCKTSPDDLRLILIDPKRLEFAPYADIAHLVFPIVTDPKIAPSVLRWVVGQMEQRYALMAQAGARNIQDYRQLPDREPLPFIVVIIDELADLMMTAGKEVEDAIIRITQMARAAGIHLIAATQRPSVDVITGLIKVNLPSRISFRVTSKVDSRTILDCAGADKLLGRGDMLFLDAHDSLLKRVHGAYVLDKEIHQVIAHIKAQRPSDYLDLQQVCHADRSGMDMQHDAMYEEVCRFIGEIEEVSMSLLQRRFRIGYNRSARMIDMLESQGIIAPSHGGKTRKVIR